MGDILPLVLVIAYEHLVIQSVGLGIHREHISRESE